MKLPQLRPFAWWIGAASALATAALATVNVVSDWGVTAEDAWIFFRYARNLAAGAGLVSYPGGVPDEGYSDLTWVLIQAAGFRLGADPETFTKTVAVMAWVLWPVGVAHLLRVAAGPSSPVPRGALWLLPALGLAASTDAGKLATSGFETPMFTLFVLLLAAWTVRTALAPSVVRGVALGLLGFVTLNSRPEGLALAVMSIGWVAVLPWLRSGSVRTGLPAASAAGAVLVGLVLGLVLWKQSYFGDFRPNPALLKLALAQWKSSSGFFWRYVTDRGVAGGLVLGATALWLPAALFTAARSRCQNPFCVVLVVVASFTVVQIGLAVYSGGDSSFRYFVPAEPGVTALSCMLGWSLAQRVTGRWSSALLVAPTLLWAWSSFDLDDVRRQLDRHPRPAPEGYLRAVERLKPLVEPGRELYACSEMGYIAYHVDAPVIDIMGLNQREVARTHKYYSIEEAVIASRDFVLSRLPRVITTHGYWAGADGGVELDPAVAWCYGPYFDSPFYQQHYDYRTDLSPTEPWRLQMFLAHRRDGFVPTARLEAGGGHDDKLMYGIDPDGWWVERLARVLLTPAADDRTVTVSGTVTEGSAMRLSLRVNRYSVGDYKLAELDLPSTGSFTLEGRLPAWFRERNMLVSLWTISPNTTAALEGHLWRLGSAAVHP